MPVCGQRFLETPNNIFFLQKLDNYVPLLKRNEEYFTQKLLRFIFMLQ